MKPNDVTIRKRSQIAKANRTMFIWIAAVSVVIGACGVVGYFLAKEVVYDAKVISEKQKTLSTLRKNNDAVDELKSSIRVLDTNEALASAKSSEEDRALQVILDALPSEANSLAFGASLQNKLLAGIPGLSIESMQVEPVAGVEVIEGSDTVVSNETDTTEEGSAINFQFVVKGDQAVLKQVLSNLERSIRVIQVSSMQISTLADGQTLSVSGRAFYEPKKTVELQDKVVPR